MRYKAAPNLTCAYCLCRVCNRIQCPRGRYHCMPCYHGQVLECDFFMNKQSTIVFRVKRRSPLVHVQDLEKLRDLLNKVLDNQAQEQPATKLTLQEELSLENQRHQAAIKEIQRKARRGDYSIKNRLKDSK